MNRTSRKLVFLIAAAMGLCLSSCQLLPTLNTQSISGSSSQSSIESSSQSVLEESTPDHIHVFNQMFTDPQFLVTPENGGNPAIYHYSCVCGAMSAETFCPETHSLNNLTIVEDGDDVKVERYQPHYHDFRDNWVFVPSGVTVIGSWSITYSTVHFVHLPDSLRTIESYAFEGCGVDSIEIPASVTSISSGVFSDCQNLISIRIDPANPVYDSRGNCNAVIRTEGNELVAGCQSTTIPDSVVSIGQCAFTNCASLTSISIPDSVTSIGSYAFFGCHSLSSVTISDSVVSIEEYTFYDCESLDSIIIPRSVTSIVGNPFQGCTALSSIVVDPANPVYDSRGNCNAIIRTAENELVITCKSTTIPDSVTSIGYAAFLGCCSFTSIAIPDSVVSIGEFAFQACRSLSSITIPDSVVSIGWGAFAQCESLASIAIPRSVTSIMGNPVWDCAALSSIAVDPANPVYDSRGNCNAIIKTADNELVSGCQSTTIPDSITSIGSHAFSGCYALASIAIPDSVVSIGERAFMDAYPLRAIEIPCSVTTIGNGAFSGIGSLTDVYFTGTVEQWNAIHIGDENELLSQANIHFNSTMPQD
ncbi:MAG: leucine-rich repeat domain-containing protein [Candidatus Enteromonas sp.]|nr:leucine-rich repeat domain-containing protein [Candidatus Enteromonas sp.]